MSDHDNGPSPLRSRATPAASEHGRSGPSGARRSRLSWSRGPLAACLAALAGAATAVALTACGGSGKGLIPLANAGPLQHDFEEIAQSAQAGSGDCTATTEAINKTERDFAALPSTIDAGLHARLSEGISNLRERALALCAQPSTQTTSATSVPRTTTSTTTTRTQTTPATTPTATTPTAPTTTPTTPTTTSPPPNNGGGTVAPGEGGDNGNGNGSENEQGGGTRAGEAGGAGAPEGGK